MAFAADDVAGIEVVYVGADFDDLANEFVANGHGDGDGFLSPVVPLVDVDVSAADAGVADADEDVIDADFGFGNFFEPEARLSLAFD